jgi:hypothetical protein
MPDLTHEQYADESAELLREQMTAGNSRPELVTVAGHLAHAISMHAELAHDEARRGPPPAGRHQLRTDEPGRFGAAGPEQEGADGHHRGRERARPAEPEGRVALFYERQANHERRVQIPKDDEVRRQRRSGSAPTELPQEVIDAVITLPQEVWSTAAGQGRR